MLFMILLMIQLVEKNVQVNNKNCFFLLLIIFYYYFKIVQTGSAVSVAERARLFGTQISRSSAPPKNAKPPQSTVNKYPPKVRLVPEDQNYESVIHEERNYEPQRPNSMYEDRNYQPYRSQVQRYPKQDTS